MSAFHAASRTACAALALAVASGVSANIASAQTNNNQPTASWRVDVVPPGAKAFGVAECNGTLHGVSPLQPVRQSSSCDLSALIMDPNTDTPLFASALISSTGAGAIPTQGVNAAAVVSGSTNTDDGAATVRLRASGSLTNFVTVSGPNDIFTAVLTSQYETQRRVDGSVRSSSIDYSLYAFAIDAAGNPSQSLGDAAGGNPPDGVTFGQITNRIEWSLLLGRPFAYSLFASATMDVAGTTSGDVYATSFLSNPTITLYNQAGEDVTAFHTITIDNGQTFAANPPVTATPEPASLMLLATGFAGVAGAARRRGGSAVRSTVSRLFHKTLTQSAS